MKPSRWLCVSLVIQLALAVSVPAQTWQPVPFGGVQSGGVPLLLTDGSVMIHNADSGSWFKLTPDLNGNYVGGTWTQLASLPAGYGPLFFASAVLADGRVFVMGGEYNLGVLTMINRGAIYDPLTNGWTELAPPPGWTEIGDAQCAVLPDGRLMLADPFNTNSALLDPVTLAWTPGGPGKVDAFDEEGWVLLPDSSLLTVDNESAPQTERYIPSLNQWVSAGSTPVLLADPASKELGPMVLRRDGTVVAFGATGHNAIYFPGTNLLDLGTWVAATNFPSLNGVQLDIADGPACLLPSGHVLCGASPGVIQGVFQNGTHFFEFDGATLHLVPGTPHSLSNPSYVGNMLVLPSGQVLYTDQSSDIEIYTPAPGIGSDAWRPTLANCPALVNAGDTFILEGTQFNGLSQGNAYGDDASNAENYPIVRIKNVASGHVFYCRTANHSTMAVATGVAPTSTQVTLPGAIESGPSTLEVVANGIPSFPVALAVSAGSTNFPLAYELAPLTAQSGAAAFVMTITGANFQLGDTVDWSAGTVTTPLATTFVSSSQLAASVPAALVANPGSASVRVIRADGTLGNTMAFTTTPAVPVLTSINPASAAQGSLGFTLTVTGQRFASDDVVIWNLNNALTPLATTLVSSTTLSAIVPTNLLQTAGTVVVNVADSLGQTSSNALFVINPAPPVLNALTPTSVAVNSPSFTLTCSGNFYFDTSQVFWVVGGTKTLLATTYVSPTTLTATVPGTLLTAVGTANVFVNTPNVGTSASLQFAITPPLSLVSISPNTAVAGTTFTLTATGTDFHPGDSVLINSILVPATVISDSQLTATIPGTDIPFGGTTSVIIINGDFTAVSNPLTFTVQFPKPQITALSPSTVAAGGPSFTLTVTGTGFQPLSVVRWNGTLLFTTYVSATQLQASVPASLFVQKNTYTIDVQNPSPGGGGSNGMSLIAN